MTLRRATLWSCFWIATALCFSAFLYMWRGQDAATLFLAGYVLEKSLSVDNLMVFAAIFSYFRIKAQYQPAVLYWGIIGAVVFRAIFVTIGAGSLLLAGPIIGIGFGALVLWSAFKMLALDDGGSEDVDYANTWYGKITRKLLPPSAVKIAPYAMCLVAIEVSDIMFSFDSIPAVIAVVRDPLLVYASVMFAVLGLRSLYFVLAALMRYLVHLGKAVIVLLFFVGMKLMVYSAAELLGQHLPEIAPATNLGIVIGVLTVGVVASFIDRRGDMV